MDDSIVDKAKLHSFPPQTHYLEAKDLPIIAAKSGKEVNFDDLFDLTQVGLFSSPTPYKAGISLLNNGSANYYDREHNRHVMNNKFQDCVETSMRHISNLLTFSPINRKFDLGNINAFVAAQEAETGVKNPYFENYERFYEKQTLLLANAGDVGVRSLWNTVVGNLPNTIYKQKGTNEIISGFINLLNTFDTVFGLSLKGAPKAGFEAKQIWLEESLQTLFSALNPSYNYTLDLKGSQFGEELIGEVLVTVANKEQNENLFSFNLLARKAS